MITLKREVPKEAVCHVFEKVNTGGMVLNAFELLTATYAADNFNLRDDWYGNTDRGVEGIHLRFLKKKVLQGITNTDFLQTVTLRDAAAEGFVRASVFLHLEHIYLARSIRRETTCSKC